MLKQDFVCTRLLETANPIFSSVMISSVTQVLTLVEVVAPSRIFGFGGIAMGR